MNNAGLTPAQCAIGFRTMNLLSGQNIDAEAASQFIGDTYKKCKEFEVTPKFATSIKEIIKASDDHHIPLSKIEDYNTQKIAKKKELENELENLKNEISTLKESQVGNRKCSGPGFAGKENGRFRESRILMQNKCWIEIIYPLTKIFPNLPELLIALQNMDTIPRG